ncbi:MAG: hypothetical protein AAFW70_10995 [Cyanobacteria bacterium J06635_10]
MSENPLYYSDSQTLKPALSAALASLEVKLDEELARYRRTRAAHRTPTQKSLGSLIAAKPQAQSAITVANIRNQQSLTGEEAVAYIRQQQANNPLGNLETPPPPPRAPKTSPKVGESQGINSEPKQIPFINEQTIPPSYTETTKARNRTTTAQNQSSIVKTDINQNTQANNLPDSKNDAPKQPDDYLESSEALLRSLAEEEQQ